MLYVWCVALVDDVVYPLKPPVFSNNKQKAKSYEPKALNETMLPMKRKKSITISHTQHGTTPIPILKHTCLLWAIKLLARNMSSNKTYLKLTQLKEPSSCLRDLSWYSGKRRTLLFIWSQSFWLLFLGVNWK